MNNMSGLQLQRTIALASFYGHEWAVVVQQHYGENLPEALSLEEIEQLVETERAAHPLDLPGIGCPEVDNNGVVHHITGTGRTEYVVSPDGSVTIEVSRPAGPVLSGRVNPDGSWDVWEEPGAREIGYFRRHVVALQDAIRAIVPGADVESLLPADEQAFLLYDRGHEVLGAYRSRAEAEAASYGLNYAAGPAIGEYTLAELQNRDDLHHERAAAEEAGLL